MGILTMICDAAIDEIQINDIVRWFRVTIREYFVTSKYVIDDIGCHNKVLYTIVFNYIRHQSQSGETIEGS